MPRFVKKIVKAPVRAGGSPVPKGAHMMPDMTIMKNTPKMRKGRRSGA